MNRTTKTPLSDYVDYTARRRLKSTVNPNLETNANNISSAREHLNYRTEFIWIHHLLRRHVGIDAQVAEIYSDDSDIDRHCWAIEWKIDDFKVGKHLGTGKFGTVYLAQEKRSKTVVTLKILRKEELEKEKVVQFVKREVEIQAHLHHPHIIQLFGYFHDKTNIYLVLEYAEQGELFKKLDADKAFTESQAANYIIQLSQALEYMQRFGIIHRDLKLENILLSKDGQVKIGDFGWAVQDPRPRRRTLCGTLDYLSPEMISNEPHTQMVDVWSLGIICYELIVGKPPFEELGSDERVSVEKTYDRIKRVDVKFPKGISREARQFISKLLQRNPSERMKLSDIKNDVWIKQYGY
ncbi:unnamed protein product [Rhizopus stolonifer]